MLDEMPLGVCQLFPILVILGKVDFFSSPKRSLVFLVHLPDLRILNGKHDPSAGIVHEQRV